MKKKSLIIILLTICLLLSACGNKTNSENSKTGPEEVSGDDNKTLIMAIAAETNTLSPLYMGNANMCTDPLVYENLVNYKGGKIVPGLAESWEFSNDGKTLTFHLRRNLKFHDGRDCDAEAVKENLLHKKSNPSFYTLKAVTDIVNIETPDESTLIINYDHPYFAYLNDFCWNDVMTICSPDLLIEGDFQTVKGVSGTGPYIYDEIKAGQYTRFIRNENYWGEKPYWDEVIVKYIPDSASRIKALKTGEIDMIYGSALMTYDDFKQASEIPNISGKVSDLDTRARDLTLNASSEFLNDLRVRQAIAYAINKEEISEGLTYGYEKAAEIPFTLDSPFTDVNLNYDYSFDLDKANQLLDEAGWKLNEGSGIREKDGKKLSLLLTMDEGFDSLNKPLGTLLKTQLQKIGIDLSIKGMEQMEWYNGFMQGDFDITIWQPQYNYAAPHCWFTPMDTMTPQTVSLQGMPESERFIETIHAMTQTDDEAEVRDICEYLYNYDMGQVMDIPLTYSKDMIVYNESKIADYKFVTTPCFFDIQYLKPLIKD